MIGRTTQHGQALRTDADVVLYLLESVGVAMIPGSAYGVALFLRMPMAAGLEVIGNGCRRIASALSALHA